MTKELKRSPVCMDCHSPAKSRKHRYCEKCRVKHVQRNQLNYRNQHKTKISAYQARYRLRNRDKQRKYMAEWYTKNIGRKRVPKTTQAA